MPLNRDLNTAIDAKAQAALDAASKELAERAQQRVAAGVKEIESLQKQIEALNKSGKASANYAKDLEALRQKLESVILTVKSGEDEYHRYNKIVDESAEAQSVFGTTADFARFRLTGLLQTFNQKINTLRTAARETSDYNVILERSARMLSSNSKEMGTNFERLRTLRAELGLTREEHKKLIGSFERMVAVGNDLERFKKLYRDLQGSVGPGAALEITQQVIERERSHPGFMREVDTDPVRALARTKGYEDAKFIQELRHASDVSEKVGPLSMERTLEVWADNLTSAFGDSMEKYLGSGAPVTGAIVAGGATLTYMYIASKDALIALGETNISLRGIFSEVKGIFRIMESTSASSGGGTVLTRSGRRKNRRQRGFGDSRGRVGRFLGKYFTRGNLGNSIKGSIRGIGLGALATVGTDLVTSLALDKARASKDKTAFGVGERGWEIARGVSGIAGATATGAAAGSFIPVVGTGIGAAVGLGLGMYANRNDLFNTSGTDKSAAIKEKMAQADRANAEIAGKDTREAAVLSLRKAERRKAAVRGGEADIYSTIREYGAGVEDANVLYREALAQQQDALALVTKETLILESKKARGQKLSKAEEEQLKFLSQMNVTIRGKIADLEATNAEAKSAVSTLDQIDSAYNKQLSIEKNIAQIYQTRAKLATSIFGSSAGILAAYSKSLQAMELEESTLMARARGYNTVEQELRNKGEWTPERQLEFKLKRSALEAEKAAVQLSKFEASLQAVKEVLDTPFQTQGVRLREGQRNLLAAGGQLVGAEESEELTLKLGRQMAASLRADVVEIHKNLQVAQRDALDTMNRETDKIRARVASGQLTEQEGQNQIAAMRTNLETELYTKQIALYNKSKEARDAEANAVKDAIAVMQRKVGAESQVIAAQTDLAEYMGASYSQIFELSKAQLDLKLQEYELGKQLLENEKRRLTEAMGSEAAALQSASYKEKEAELQKQSVEITKMALVKQRDFLDRALGRAFGVASGSSFNPVQNNRLMFGQFVQDSLGTVRAGEGQTIAQRAQTLGGRLGTPTVAQFTQTGLGLPNAGTTTAGMPAASSTDISGNIKVNIGLQDNFFKVLEAHVDMYMENKSKPGHK